MIDNMGPTKDSCMTKTSSHVILALDFDNQHKALAFVDKVSPELCRLKVGKELFTHSGPEFVNALVKRGFDVFLDLKYHDIPNTVAGALVQAAKMGVWMVDVHASGGKNMLLSAKDAIETTCPDKKPLLIGITVLTSLQENDCHEIGFSGTLEENVLNLARLCQRSGLDGVVCSPLEAKVLRRELGPDFLLITPGIRLASGQHQDQKRVMTPEKALACGADYLVMGRAVTQASDPVAVLKEVNAIT